MSPTYVVYSVGYMHKIKIILYIQELAINTGFPCGSAGKESTFNAGDLGSIPALGRSSGEGKGYLLQYSGLLLNVSIYIGLPW